MLKTFLAFFVVFLIQIYPIKGYALQDLDIREFLNDREKVWPQWNIKDLKFSDLNKDLIYPSWFEGDWIVTSEDIGNQIELPITYKVNFLSNEKGEIIGNREKNSEAIGKEIFGDKLKKVLNDPQSFNNQVIYFNDNEFIDSRVTKRIQIIDNSLFFSDEFLIQKVYKNGISRVNQVEIMSKFYKCDKNENLDFVQKPDICGLQYTASYGSKIGNTKLKPVAYNKYKLTFKAIDS
tara:strand:- start:17 stop:721 length:705 start_codon:yes stop_codon:yes gene_type:complete